MAAPGSGVGVPGSGALNKGGSALVGSVSCASAGNCAVGGFYTDGSGNQQAFVVSQKNGARGKAIEVPGSGALNKGGAASVGSVSCVSAGNCSAGGTYMDGSGHFQLLVASERNGTWGKAIEVPGTGALNAGAEAGVGSVSCASAGNCSAGGGYCDGFDAFQMFVASERNGTWGKAIEVPGSGALNAGGFAQIASLSCASAGNCSAGGTYRDVPGHGQAFVVSETNGTWRKAIEVSGALDKGGGGGAGVTSVSCRLAGNCAAGGTYTDGSGHIQSFVVSQA